MLLAACLLAAAGAAATVVRWAVHRVDALGRVQDFPVIGVSVLLVIVVATGIPVIRHAQAERRLSDVASDLVGAPVTVRCETLSQAWTDAHPELGYVRFTADGPEHTATITAQACSDLRSWIGSDHAAPSLQMVIAVHVLTHEAMHMTGRQDESVAECAAVQRDARTARELGATPAQARALAVRYWAAIYPQLDGAYRTPRCAPDAPLDEHLGDAPWDGVKSS
jgi:hypothetical protein